MRARATASLVMIGVILVAGACLGAVPQTMSYQGMLRDYDGNIVPDGNYSVVFRIYDVESGGTAIWGEPDTVVVSDGVFSTILGDLYAILLPFDVQYWLSIEVESTGELSPRIQLTSSPYARMAGDFELPHAGNLEMDLNAFTIINTLGPAIYGSSTNRTGLTGVSTNSDGVRGTGITGVAGYSPSGTSGIGVYGYNQSNGNSGRLGSSFCGVYGESPANGTEGGLAYGIYAVYGKSDSLGLAGQFDGRVQILDNLWVDGRAEMTGFQLTASPVAGYVLTSNAEGVGSWQAPSGGLTLPYAGSTATSGAAFSVTNTTGGGVKGTSTDNYWMGGWSTNNYGVYGSGGFGGVYGTSTYGEGVRGYTSGAGSKGVYGEHSGGNYGWLADDTYGVYGYSGSGYAGYFSGSAKVTANLEVGNMARVQGATWPTTGKSMELGYDSALHRGYIQVYDRAGGASAWGDLFMGLGRVGFGTSAPARPVHIKDVLRLEPRSDYPSSPGDGDLCVVGASGSRHLYCYLNGAWKQLD